MKQTNNFKLPYFERTSPSGGITIRWFSHVARKIWTSIQLDDVRRPRMVRHFSR
jgi:hypothetical protein